MHAHARTCNVAAGLSAMKQGLYMTASRRLYMSAHKQLDKGSCSRHAFQEHSCQICL